MALLALPSALASAGDSARAVGDTRLRVPPLRVLEGSQAELADFGFAICQQYRETGSNGLTTILLLEGRHCPRREPVRRFHDDYHPCES